MLPGRAWRNEYGALDLLCSPDGPSPRFGSCYLLLAPNVSRRCTFTYLDSHLEPLERGTFEQFDDVFAALLLESFGRETALGQPGLRPRELLESLQQRLELPKGSRVGEPVRSLDHYVEAQVHGPIPLDRDAECLVADASFETSPTGDVLRDLCHRLGIELVWQGGFAMEASAVPSDFRGPTMPSLAKRIAVESRIDANAIGQAVLDVHQNPTAWTDRGGEETALVELKRLWHVLVRYGRHLKR